MQNVLLAIYTFISTLIFTGKSVFKYKIPTESKTETVQLLGSTYKVTESVANGFAKVVAEKQ